MTSLRAQVHGTRKGQGLVYVVGYGYGVMSEVQDFYPNCQTKIQQFSYSVFPEVVEWAGTPASW